MMRRSHSDDNLDEHDVAAVGKMHRRHADNRQALLFPPLRSRCRCPTTEYFCCEEIVARVAWSLPNHTPSAIDSDQIPDDDYPITA